MDSILSTPPPGVVELARLTECTAEDARAWLAGQRLPDIEPLRAIVRGLDIPPRQLVGLDPFDAGARRVRALVKDWPAEDRDRLARLLEGVRAGDSRIEQIIEMLERGQLDPATVLRNI